MTIATTEPCTDAITAAQKRALRNADRIIFRLRDGQATIEAVKEADRSDTGFEQIVVIKVGGVRMNDYGPKTRHYPDAHEYTGFHMEMSPKHDGGFMQTIIRRIRVGGFINLLWTRDNNNELIRVAGMHFDSLDLVISGPKKDDRFPVADFYRVRSSCTYDNSARMIQRS